MMGKDHVMIMEEDDYQQNEILYDIIIKEGNKGIISLF